MVDINKIIDEKQYQNLKNIDITNNIIPEGYIDYTNIETPEKILLSLQGHQIFISNILNPITPYKRLLLYHGTGTGKSLAIHALAREYIYYIKRMKQQPSIIIIGFTEKIIINELLKFPDLGYIKTSEQDELIRLRESNLERDILKRRGLQAAIKRRVTDRTRGGYYRFLGYQKFALDLLIITPKGIQKGLTHTYFYENEDTFIKKIEDESKEETVQINRELIESLKYSLIACDEIHNTYNMYEKNNRGMAIKLALDILEKEDPISSPKVIFASATPLTSSPTEIVELLNLLIPLSDFKRTEFFDYNKKLRPGALEKISKISSGYVSFLKDSNIKDYPTKIMVGEIIPGIEFLKFIICSMSKFHSETIKSFKDIDSDTLFMTGNYSLYDMVFPNPESNKIGLYKTLQIKASILNASESWKTQNEIYISDKSETPYGNFLLLKNIGKYSAKYKELLESIIGLLDSKQPGKILIYHHFVAGSGILLLKQMFMENGFLFESSASVGTTRCTYCGILLRNHNKVTAHPFTPTRFLVIYGESVDNDKSLFLFNSPKNTVGGEYRIMIGSRIMQEGIDFNCIRYLYVISMPKDISTLIQVIGRAVRRRSHILLPKEYRQVYINILVSVFEDNILKSPEVIMYKRKMTIYHQIQLIERELRKYAIDNFINYKEGEYIKQPTLEGLPYKPEIIYKKLKDIAPKDITTFYAYGYSIEEVHILIKIIKKAFIIRPIWKYNDLWKEIKDPFITIKTPYDHSLFYEENFKLALDALVNGTYMELMTEYSTTNDVNTAYIIVAGESRRIVYYKPYYILCSTDEIGIPVIDYDQYMRNNQTDIITSVSLTKYADLSTGQKNFSNYMAIYKHKYIKNPKISLVEMDPTFHNTIMKYYIENKNKYTEFKDLLKLYEELNIFIYYDSFMSSSIAKTYGYTKSNKPIGFLAGDNVALYNESKWIYIQASLLRQHVRLENNIIIGFTKTIGEIQVLKLRLPLHKIKIFKDRRKISRGAVCETYSIQERKNILKKLVVSYDRDDDLCEVILYNLLDREIRDRNTSKGERWLYLWSDKIPFL